MPETDVYIELRIRIETKAHNPVAMERDAEHVGEEVQRLIRDFAYPETYVLSNNPKRVLNSGT